MPVSNRMVSAVDDWLNTLDTPRRPHEHDGKRLLSSVGLAVPDGVLVEADSQSTVSRQLDRFDSTGHYVAKVCSPNILHKTEKDGVVLNLEGEELADAVLELQSMFPGSPVLAERMVTFGGPEIIVGALHDPVFGPAVMAGAGGIFTELYSDVAFRLSPCPRIEAGRMLSELTVFPALTGFRGISSDVGALAEVIEIVADLADILMCEGCQLDINPVVWDSSKWVALDVKVVL
jgi:acetate---CoA ligase (ADP-forming) subunit beta